MIKREGPCNWTEEDIAIMERVYKNSANISFDWEYGQCIWEDDSWFDWSRIFQDEIDADLMLMLTKIKTIPAARLVALKFIEANSA